MLRSIENLIAWLVSPIFPADCPWWHIYFPSFLSLPWIALWFGRHPETGKLNVRFVDPNEQPFDHPAYDIDVFMYMLVGREKQD